MLLERDGETRWRLDRLPVNRLDVEGQDLGWIVRFRVAVKTGGFPLEIQVALQVPFILLQVGNVWIETGSRCEVTVPLLGKVGSIQCNVGSAAGSFLGMTSKAQDLEGGQQAGDFVFLGA